MTNARDRVPEGPGAGALAPERPGRPPHALPPAAAARRLEVDPATGLGAAEVTRRRAALGPNRLPPPERERLLRRIWRGIAEPMTVLLLVAAAVSGLVLGERVDAVAILAIVLLNLTIGLVEEGRATRALEAVTALQQPEARVRRDGRLTVVGVADLVPGDVVLLGAGDRVPADLRLIAGDALEVDESTLTGESLAVAKDPGSVVSGDAALGEHAGMAYSGTLVMAGRGEGVVTATGQRTVLGGIASRLRTTEEPTPLQRELAHLTGRLGLIAVVVAAAVFALSLWRVAGGLEEAFLAAVALAVAAVPEGLATVTLVALALGVRRMAGRGALIRRLPAVETLGAVTVMVVDKTGTLTENRMRPDTVAYLGSGFVPVTELPPALRPAVEAVAALCNDGTLAPVTGDPTDVALLELLPPGRVQALRAERPRLGEIGFDSDRKRMTVLNADPDGPVLRVKGAPEAVLPRCSHALDGSGARRPLDDEARARTLDAVGKAAWRGARVLALADRPLAEAGGRADRETLAGLEDQLTLVALVALRDAIRPQAAGSVDEARGAGVHLLMATGDHPGTAAAVASRVGMVGERPEVRTGADLRRDGLPDDPVATPVYARVDPDQKFDLVGALQARGHVVGMTGDGVNDAPALSTADIGVALGARGSDVAKEAADMVVVDDDLGTIVGAVREGRGIYDNIRKVVDYLVAGNLSEIAVVVGALLVVPSLGVPLLPLQLLWINLLTDGLPALALGVDPVDRGLMRQPPRRRGTKLLSAERVGRLSARAALIAATSIAALLVGVGPFGHPSAQARTLAFTTLVATHLLYAFVARMPERRVRGRGTPAGATVPWYGTVWLAGAVAAGVGLQVLVVVWGPAQTVFTTVALDARDWALVAGLTVACTAGLAVMVRLQGRRARRRP